MLLGGETQTDSFSPTPTSNGNISANENESAPILLNGSPGNSSTSPTLEPTLSNVNLLQNRSSTISIQQQMISDDYNKVSPKDSNQNFLPSESNLEMYQPQHQTHINARVQPYDLNVAHHHHLRSSSNQMQYNGSNGINGRKVPSPYKNLNLSINQNAILYDNGHLVSSSSGSEMMVLKEEPENGY